MEEQMTRLTFAGTAGFLLWGLLHAAGGAAILVGLAQSPEAAYGFYRHDAEAIPPVAGAALGYLAYGFATAGAVAAAVALRLNRRNDPTGLAINSILVVLVELGLVIFFLAPGYLGFTDAAPGLILAAAGMVFGGLACRGGHHAAQIG
jgi:Ca2+/H+ antiporter